MSAPCLARGSPGRLALANVAADILNNLPLAELHCHLEATVEPDDARIFAKRNSIDISGVFNDQGDYHWRDFKEFLDTYDAVSEAIRTPQDYYELTLHYYTRMAARGVIYGEVFVSPEHAGKFGISYTALIDAVAAAMREAEAKSGIVGRIIVTCVRHFGSEHATATAQLAVDHPHPMVTGFGMAGDEAFGAAADYARAFDIARDAGLGLTAHAGEILGPESVHEAITLFHVDRIGHGVRILEDDALAAAVKDWGLTLEVCPTSNVAIGLYPSLERHPLPALVAAGLKVTLNADDPAYFDVDVADEYRKSAEIHGFERERLAGFTRTAIEAAFCDSKTKVELLTRLDRN